MNIAFYFLANSSAVLDVTSKFYVYSMFGGVLHNFEKNRWSELQPKDFLDENLFLAEAGWRSTNTEIKHILTTYGHTRGTIELKFYEEKKNVENKLDFVPFWSLKNTIILVFLLFGGNWWPQDWCKKGLRNVLFTKFWVDKDCFLYTFA